MVRVERSIVINMPVNQVFAFVGTGFPRNLKAWSESVQEVQEATPGPAGVGTTMQLVRILRGKPEQVTNRITEFEKNSRFAFDIDGVMPGKGVYEFVPEGNSTKVTVALDMEPGGLGKLAGPVIGRELGKSLEVDLAKMKSIIESA